ncbi:hypothetical protein LY76DRAFT_590482 [Colletotrichum caudatum]|nr:hypothetical protein LY76DRAFT_590482 [Colletotrichum caudatum]
MRSGPLGVRSGPASAYRMSGDIGACRATVTNGFLGSIGISIFGFVPTYIATPRCLAVYPRGSLWPWP